MLDKSMLTIITTLIGQDTSSPNPHKTSFSEEVFIGYSFVNDRAANKKSVKKTTGASGVYADTTAPLDEESKGMLKSGQNGGEQVEMEVGNALL